MRRLSDDFNPDWSNDDRNEECFFPSNRAYEIAFPEFCPLINVFLDI
jgi:hypothetical protein